MNAKQRVKKLEKAMPTMNSGERVERINRVLENPSLVSLSAYQRIVELLAIARRRKERNEYKAENKATGKGKA